MSEPLWWKKRDRAVGQAMNLFRHVMDAAKQGRYVDDATMAELREKLNEITAISKSNEGK
jgi:hypothetical protein